MTEERKTSATCKISTILWALCTS